MRTVPATRSNYSDSREIISETCTFDTKQAGGRFPEQRIALSAPGGVRYLFLRRCPRSVWRAFGAPPFGNFFRETLSPAARNHGKVK